MKKDDKKNKTSKKNEDKVKNKSPKKEDKKEDKKKEDKKEDKKKDDKKENKKKEDKKEDKKKDDKKENKKKDDKKEDKKKDDKKEDKKKDDKKENPKKEDELIPDRPELEKIKSQKINLFCPPENMSPYPRTLFFINNPNFNDNNPIRTRGKITSYEIISKKYMMVYKTYRDTSICLKEVMRHNNLIRSKLFEDTNLIWKIIVSQEMVPFIKHLNKYQRYNHFPFTWELSRKDYLYTHYKIMQNKFPKDFNYIPQSFILPRDKELITLLFKDYNLEIDNLFLIRPFGSSKGKEVQFFTNIENLPKSCILTHYISNPHLIDNTKYNLRFYVLVTGFCPLKIYFYKEGFANFASQKYSFDLNEKGLNNKKIHITKHLDNNEKEENDSDSSSSDSSNSKSKYTKSEDNDIGKIICFSELKKWFKERKLHFSKIKRKIKDIIIKTFLSIADKGIQQLKEININSGNLFELFGVDIILDYKLRPWLLEITLNPNLNCTSFIEEKIKSKLITDTLNIIGLIPYSHDGKYKIYDKEDKYKDNIEEAINETLHELERPCGDFKRIFPLIENIDLYSKYLENPGEENLALWDVIHKKNK